MNLLNVYTDMWKNSETKIGSGDYQMDARVQAMFDTRRGISLVLYPSAEVKENIASFLSDIYSYEPEQYYYPFLDIHITVLSVISCAENFLLKRINVQEYIDVLTEAMKTSRSFSISFQGITASPSCVMVQGFPSDDSLQQLRESVRTQVRMSGLYESMDARYNLETAHSTVIRFSNPLRNPQRLVELLSKYRNTDFGSFNCIEVALVYNDWYQRNQHVQLLHTFSLR